MNKLQKAYADGKATLAELEAHLEGDETGRRLALKLHAIANRAVEAYAEEQGDDAAALFDGHDKPPQPVAEADEPAGEGEA